MNNPEVAALFSDPENPSMGRMTSCIGGWTCYTINLVKQKAYGLDKYYTNFDPGSGGALDAAIAGAFAKKQPIFTYYWAPTGLMGKVDLVRLASHHLTPSAGHQCKLLLKISRLMEQMHGSQLVEWSTETCH